MSNLNSTYTIGYFSRELNAYQTYHFSPSVSSQGHFLRLLFELVEVSSRKSVYTAYAYEQSLNRNLFSVLVFDRHYTDGKKFELNRVHTLHRKQIEDCPFVDMNFTYNVFPILNDILYSLFPASCASTYYEMLYFILKPCLSL